MQILKGIIIQDLFLYIPEYKTIIISDVHIGYEETLIKRGILIPKNNYNDLIIRLEKTLEKIKKTNIIEKIIINGDLIHEFGKISAKEKNLIKKFLDFLSGYGEIIFIEGNHDKSIKFIVDTNIMIKNQIKLNDILIIHGDRILDKKDLINIKTIIIGHEHPAITLKNYLKNEKFKCFLKGKYSNKNLIVMPSCNLLIEGTDVLLDKLLSPYLNKINLENFEVYITNNNETYDFGKLKNIIKINSNNHN